MRSLDILKSGLLAWVGDPCPSKRKVTAGLSLLSSLHAPGSVDPLMFVSLATQQTRLPKEN